MTLVTKKVTIVIGQLKKKKRIQGVFVYDHQREVLCACSRKNIRATTFRNQNTFLKRINSKTTQNVNTFRSLFQTKDESFFFSLQNKFL